ncbi:MAG: hypothetical protein GXY60_04385, partial [Spirochaetales bacterium]|nr:hypothetical protein [Spirochaetales bacterium]
MRETRGQDDTVQTTEMQVRSALKKKLRKRRIKRIIGYLIFMLIIVLGFFVYQFYKTNQRLPFTQPVQTRAESSGPT